MTRQNDFTQNCTNMHQQKESATHLSWPAWTGLVKPCWPKNYPAPSPPPRETACYELLASPPTHQPPPSSPNVIILIYCLQAREWIQTTFGRQPASLDKNQILLHPHCEGRHFRTKLMSQYIGSGQKNLKDVRIQELVSKVQNLGGKKLFYSQFLGVFDFRLIAWQRVLFERYSF